MNVPTIPLPTDTFLETEPNTGSLILRTKDAPSVCILWRDEHGKKWGCKINLRSMMEEGREVKDVADFGQVHESCDADWLAHSMEVVEEVTRLFHARLTMGGMVIEAERRLRRLLREVRQRRA